MFAHVSINALKKEAILDEEGTTQRKVLFDDLLFAYWLKRTFA